MSFITPRLHAIFVLMLVFIVVAISLPVGVSVADEEGEKYYHVSGTSQGEASATDIDSGGDLPGLLRTRAISIDVPSIPQRDTLAARFSPVVVIHQATRAPPSA